MSRPIEPDARRGASHGVQALLPWTLLFLTALLLVGCSSAPKQGEVKLSDVAGAKPRAEPKARYGNMKSYVVFGKTYYPKSSSRGHSERGIASWYGPKFHGKKTSSGEPYDMHQMTAAHKTLPLPTYALVTNLENGRNLIVKVNDRGPFVGDRIIDLSYAAAKSLGVDKKGTALVQVTSIDPRDHDGKVPKTLQLASAEMGRSHGRSTTKNTRVAADASAPSSSRSADRVASGSVDRPSSQPSPTASRTVAPATTSASARPAVAHDEPPPVQPAVATAGGGYSLQVGAFGTRANAEQMQGRLRGQLTAPVTIDVQDGALYRVRVGPVGSRADAQRLSTQLTGLGVGSALVVPH